MTCKCNNDLTPAELRKILRPRFEDILDSDLGYPCSLLGRYGSSFMQLSEDEQKKQDIKDSEHQVRYMENIINKFDRFEVMYSQLKKVAQDSLDYEKKKLRELK